MTNEEILSFLKVNLQSIQDNDMQTYNETTSEDPMLYEWWVTPHVSLNEKEMCEVTPHRVDCLPFHEFMMSSNAEGAKIASHNESRMIVKLNGTWKIIHVHKSPAWQAPHIQL